MANIAQGHDVNPPFEHPHHCFSNIDAINQAALRPQNVNEPPQNALANYADQAERTRQAAESAWAWRPQSANGANSVQSIREKRQFANPTPLGLSAFALTTFLLSLINVGASDINIPHLVIGPAFAYGGLAQFAAGMWEMAVGNTLGATAFTSYGAFWISVAIILTPGGFRIEETYKDSLNSDNGSVIAFSLYLFGWMIFTTIMLACSLKSTVASITMWFCLWFTFLLLAIAHYYPSAGKPHAILLKAGGLFGLLTAFFAWYIALAEMLNKSNSFFTLRVGHFPWSEKVKEEQRREQLEADKQAEWRKRNLPSFSDHSVEQ